MTAADEILRTEGLVKAYRGRRVVDQVNIIVNAGAKLEFSQHDQLEPVSKPVSDS